MLSISPLSLKDFLTVCLSDMKSVISHHLCVLEFQENQTSRPSCWFVLASFLLKWNCCGCWRWLKEQLYIFITNPFFDLGIIVCLIVNILFMAMVHYPLTAEFERHLSVAHLVSVKEKVKNFKPFNRTEVKAGRGYLYAHSDRGQVKIP